MSWGAASYPAPPRQVFAVTRSMLVRSLLLSIGTIVFGAFLVRVGQQVGFGPLLGAGLFGWLLIASGVAGIGQVAWGFHRPSQIVLTSDGFEWTSPLPRPLVRRTWLECGPFFLVYRNRTPGPPRIGYYTGWPAGAAFWQSQPATHWQGQIAAWPNQPMPPHGRQEIINASYSTIGPTELVELMNDYRNRAAAQQAR
jgi:hypothetical protein